MTQRPEHSDSGRVSLTAPASKSVSHAVWGYLESIPGFNEDLRAAERDIAEGRGVRFEDEDAPSDPPQPAR